MRFTQNDVQQYLTLVSDDNPIHDTIVPGQLVMDTFIAQNGWDYSRMSVRYKRSICIGEVVHLVAREDGYYHIVNEENEIKIELNIIF